jgi:HlyD family secretion protein
MRRNLMKNKKKYITFGGVVLGLVIIAIVGIRLIKSKRNRESNLQTVVVTKDNIIQKVTESGTVEPVVSIDVKSELAGEIIGFFVEEEDKVKKGQKLVMIRPEPDEAQKVAQAKASIKSKQLDLEDAERDLKRKETLFEKGFIAEQDVEDALKEYENSRIQLQLAEKQLWAMLGGGGNVDVENIDLEGTENITLTSSIDGVVTSINVEEGEKITSGTQAIGGGGTTIMTVADLSEMIVKASINEVDVIKLKKGQEVKIGFDAIRGIVYRGKVRRISPSGTEEENLVVYPVEVEILDPDDRIRPGMTADLDIIIAEANNALCIPKHAVMSREGKNMVLVKEQGKVIPKSVITGISNEINTEIKSGLQEDDTVLVSGGQGGLNASGFRSPGGREGPPRGVPGR